MRKKFAVILGACLLFTGCSEVPELLEPVGAVPNSATVERGTIYNIEYYDSAVVEEVKEINTSSDCIVKSIEVSLGSEVKSGDVLITLDGDAMSSASNTLDDQIAQFNKEADFNNRLLEADIALYNAQLKLAQADGDADGISKAQESLTDAQTALNTSKVEQAQQIANMEAQRLAGGFSDGAILAPCDGIICYLNVGAIGSSIDANTMIIGIAQKDSFMLKGSLIAEEYQENSHELYALIGNKRYNITYKPYSAAEASYLVSNNYPLYTHFFFDADESISSGMYAAIVRVWDYKENVLKIPDNALYTDEEGSYVYVIKGEDGEKERRDVVIGITTDTTVEILEGLEEGEKVYVK